MQLGMIGLGRMGGGMALRLMSGGHECVVYGRNPDHHKKIVDAGALGTASLEEFLSKLEKPRVVWVMVPEGLATEENLEALEARLRPGDILINGGNSNYKDDVRHAKACKAKGIQYLDVGTSGGIWGLERGYSLMIGGETAAVRHLDPIFKTLAPGKGSIPRTPGREQAKGTAEEGYLHCGPAGAGHFVKMVHNGIEYGVMQAFAEGLDILRNATSDKLAEDLRYSLPLADIAEVWRRGSVLSSWLLDLTADALLEDPELKAYSGVVQDSGEGRWTVLAAIEESVPADVIAASLFARFRSRVEHSFADRILSAMRNKFGGHVEPKSKA
jgi:6-phosphogluconate dehydrogenase